MQQVVAFCGMSFLLSVVPGPSVVFIVGRALAHGRRAALGSVLGNALGGYALVVAVAFGVGSVVERSVLLFNGIKLAGAAYLVWLGVRAFRGRKQRVRLEAGGSGGGGGRPVREGFLVGVTNPKSIVFLTAVLPQFVDRDAGHVPVQMLLLGFAGAVLALLSDGAWGLAASGARAWFGRSPRRLALVSGTGGVALIGLGASVAFTGTRSA
ncbi:LysE family translocator [Streptomyces sp. SBT349]|uniref:LysE family translocator n=1 Tax=Streptomyces sp. SBT349 TaxID=1580539 RepID=UPI00099CFC0C|nr:LysE family translocator [Streptomyces sp. SBT349]